MLKKNMLCLLCSLLCMSAVAWNSNTEAAHYISSMDIDVNYDPFTDTYKNSQQEEVAPGNANKTSLSQRVADLQNTNKPKFTVNHSKIVPGNVYLPKGTPLSVELTTGINAKSVLKYQTISFQTTENLFINDVIIIPKGTTGKGYVYDVQAPGAFGRKGVLRIAGKEIKTLNGVKIPLMKGISAAGKTDGGAVVVGALVSLAGGFFMKGKGVAFPIGTEFTVEVREDTDLNCKPSELAKVMSPAIPQGQKLYISPYGIPLKSN